MGSCARFVPVKNRTPFCFFGCLLFCLLFCVFVGGPFWPWVAALAVGAVGAVGPPWAVEPRRESWDFFGLGLWDECGVVTLYLKK